jgi:indolepyruvate ferredoxin oxidoreductase beta subunit
MNKNIVLMGVGGQGIILISKILSAGLLQLGYDVKMSELHGMAQRGGDVSTQVRYGDKVYSPNVGEGEADIIVAFEKAEAVRGLPFLKQGGTLIMDEKEIYPLSVQTGSVKYPDNVVEQLKKNVEHVLVLKAAEIAEKLGNPRCQNIVLLGSLIAYLGLDNVDWNVLLEENLPAKVVEINKKAFKEGYEFYKKNA